MATLGIQLQDVPVPQLRPLPHATRSQIFNALFKYLTYIPAPGDASGSIQWKTMSQRLRHWDEVPAQEQPALFLERGSETLDQKTAYGVTKIHFKCLVWIYFRSDGFKTKDLYPDMVTDPTLDAIEQLFQTNPPLSSRLTLGGVCWHCWLDGTIGTEPGLQDNQAVIVVPISLLV